MLVEFVGRKFIPRFVQNVGNIHPKVGVKHFTLKSLGSAPGLVLLVPKESPFYDILWFRPGDSHEASIFLGVLEEGGRGAT